MSTEVECCLCGGEMMEDFDCGTEYASYLCNSCGYASNSEAAESPRKALRGIPRKFRPFVKWAGFAEDSGAVLHGDMPWWPGGVEMLTEYSVFPVVVSGKLRWRREDIEEIPESERKHHPREDWLSGYYEYRSAPYHADYDSFHEACEATREQNLANALPLTSTKKLSIQLLGND